MCGRALRLRRLAATTTLGPMELIGGVPASRPSPAFASRGKGHHPRLLESGHREPSRLLFARPANAPETLSPWRRELQHNDAVRAWVATLGQSAEHGFRSERERRDDRATSLLKRAPVGGRGTDHQDQAMGAEVALLQERSTRLPLEIPEPRVNLKHDHAARDRRAGIGRAQVAGYRHLDFRPPSPRSVGASAQEVEEP